MVFKTCKYHLVNAKTRQKIYEKKMLDLYNLAPRQTVCTPLGANLTDQRTYRTRIVTHSRQKDITLKFKMDIV